MLRNFPLYVSQYRLRGLAAEISSLNTYRRALQSVSASLKEQALELQDSLNSYNHKLEELLEESLYQVESISTVGEPELKRAQNSTQLLSALCFGTMLRIEEQKISEADDQSTAFNSALQLIEAFAADKEQRYFVQLISKKNNKFEELRTNYFSNEVLICDTEQKPRIICGQLSELFLNNPRMGLLSPEDIQVLHDYATQDTDKQGLAVDREPDGQEHEELIDSLHRLNDDITKMLELFKAESIDESNDIAHNSESREVKMESPMNSSAVEKSGIEEQPNSAQKDESILEDKSQKLLSLFHHVNLAALKSLNAYLSDIRDGIVLAWTQSATDTRGTDKSPENSDDIDDKSPEDFLDGIVSTLGSANDISEQFKRILNGMRISIDPSNLIQETPVIKDITEVVNRIKQLTNQRQQLDELISTITAATFAVSSAPEDNFTDVESAEYLEIFNSAAGDFQSMSLYLSTARDTIQSTIDALEKNLIEKFAGLMTNMAQAEYNALTSNRDAAPGDQNQTNTSESFSSTVSVLRNTFKTIPTNVERWESQVKTRVDAYSKEQAQLTNSTTVAKYSSMILEHKQAIESLLDAAHQEIDEILAAGLGYSSQACALYMEQLKLTATIKALPCNDTSKHILSSLIAHKRCKKCKTLDWAMCRIEDGFLCCTSCAQSETGKWIKVVVS